MNIIHVAGTKGKGSTCAFIESFLRSHGHGVYFPRKTGLYTSPHLISENERIRVNFKPLPNADFARYVFEVCDGLSMSYGGEGPGFLQLLALISFHVLREKVEVAIYETHHGGEYCATNVIRHPIATAVTTIEKDHFVDLGPSIENVAWHKGGIFKRGAVAFTVPQKPHISAVLHRRAIDKEVALKVIDVDPTLPNEFESDAQRLNCSLARAVVDAFLLALDQRCPNLSEEEVTQGIRQFYRPGRFETIFDSDHIWFVDGAHNEISIVEAGSWFQRSSTKRFALSILLL